MMKIYLFTAILTLGCFSLLQAQNPVQDLKKAASGVTVTKDPKDTTRQTWKTGGLYNLTFNQAALSNWAAGGDNSAISLSTLLNMYAFYLDGKRSWDNTLTLAYGLTRTTSLGTRKADDRIDLVSKYGYDLGKKWYLTTLFNFRSQFAKGYNYPKTGPNVLTSDFLAPAYLLLSLGMDYKPNDHFSFFISPATIREVIVNNDSLAAQAAFGVDSGKKSRFEFGAYASINYSTSLSKTASYATKLDLFSNYLHNPQDVSLYMTNILNVKATEAISMNLSVTLVYDNDIKAVKSDGTHGGAALQFQEILGIGLAFKFDNRKRMPVKPGS
ncbi:MAG: DUF3078 domain-containing protein [Bacteroidota bacterium]|nr:DUF3078 domain-containing protein [Bacteroidota bacterium]MDP4217859.1 DUF3078 domain-containing protein [Bacteroidota bacterium]MDP4247294.1 DUF3078 domain-containing protein [Bacteroidota bacterium]MDP4254545.1 DUF3078 domain-containing protein [Bacteroidota bacterium]MDP4258990.1 DUF3078 domain-containing protein [Bacteroidota bacterium]